MQTAKENNKGKTVGQDEIEGVAKDDLTVVQFFLFFPPLFLLIFVGSVLWGL